MSPTRDPTSLNSEQIAVAAEKLRAGQLVAFPTETVYGLGADATNPLAVAGIFEVKGRPRFDPLIVHLYEMSGVIRVVSEFPRLAQALADASWPGPLTLVLPKRSLIPEIVTAGLPGVGVRIPRHPVALELLRQVGRPVAAPSANPFGRISPTTAQHVRDGLGTAVNWILDGGPCDVGVESTVLSLMESQPVLLRPGGVSREELEAVIGPVQRAVMDERAEDSAQPAPGMLSRHYAPRTPLVLIERGETAQPVPGKRCGLLTDGTQDRRDGFEQIVSLSETGDLRTCAAGFFAGLRSLDSASLDVIIAHRFSNDGLGVALNDRLQRAAASR